MTEQQKLELEQKEAANLINKGVTFKIGKKDYLMKELKGGTLDLISEIAVNIQIDEEALKENPIGESKQISKKASMACAKILAYAVLNDKWKIRFFSRRLASKILWQYKPSQLLKAAILIAEMSNYADFINSIRLIAGVRTAKPNPIEKNN